MQVWPGARRAPTSRPARRQGLVVERKGGRRRSFEQFCRVFHSPVEKKTSRKRKNDNISTNVFHTKNEKAAEFFNEMVENFRGCVFGRHKIAGFVENRPGGGAPAQPGDPPPSRMARCAFLVSLANTSCQERRARCSTSSCGTAPSSRMLIQLRLSE